MSVSSSITGSADGVCSAGACEHAAARDTAARCGQVPHRQDLTGMRATTLISTSKPASQVTPTAVHAG
jgi:hypothetical protein